MLSYVILFLFIAIAVKPADTQLDLNSLGGGLLSIPGIPGINNQKGDFFNLGGLSNLISGINNQKHRVAVQRRARKNRRH
ncbi:unnamed protein product [Cylicocyclus nassatus]|uniref:Uncharacterized protein n=1 Tax=Cylicocyclus nassatus TaxID=53992 RepID=A0AA36DP48_CYLNA|nr:unnamed protein product [Cylicocyclus nassatus]